MVLSEADRFEFIGLNFHNLSLVRAIDLLEHFIQSGSPHMVFTPTAELIVWANENQRLKDIYNCTDLLTADGFVVHYAARLCGKPINEPVSAVRLMFKFLEVASKKEYRLYLLGAKEDIVNKAVDNIKANYPAINIVGWHNGYFDFNNDAKIISDIREKKPDVLFVAMSSPLKENFISKNLEAMGVPVCMGVGGSFDIIAGKYHLAPMWISKIGLEWLYRLIQEPKRLWRRYLVTNTKFLCLLTKELLKKRED